MRLLLIADTYPPARISGAQQMRDLALALARQGHEPVVLTPAWGQRDKVVLEHVDGVRVLRVEAPRTKDVPLAKRALAESMLPWVLLRGLKSSALRTHAWDGIVWYSPTIFLGPLVRALVRRHKCPTYLILRDLFPDWAVDAKVMRKGMAYRVFKFVERYQYRQAGTVGVQTPSNAPLLGRDAPGVEIEVLHNWLSPLPLGGGAVPNLGHLEGRILFVYAGNMGVAQDMDAFIELARRMRDREDVGFVFVGRGSETDRLRMEATGQSNIRMLEEIPSEALALLLQRCHVGIIALHPAHATHNIPGKLLTYLHAGLPVLARVNRDNDLIGVIEDEAVGLAVAGDNPSLLHAFAIRLADDASLRNEMGSRGMKLAARTFSPSAAATQIVDSLIRQAGRKHAET